MSQTEPKPEFVWRGSGARRLRLGAMIRGTIVAGALIATGVLAAPYIGPAVTRVAAFVEDMLKAAPKPPDAEPATQQETPDAVEPQAPAGPPAQPWSEVPNGSTEQAAPTASPPTPPATPWAEVPNNGTSAAPPPSPAPAETTKVPEPQPPAGTVAPSAPSGSSEGVPSTAGEPPASAAEPDLSTGEPEPEADPDAKDSFSPKASPPEKARPRTDRTRPRDALTPNPAGQGEGYFNGSGFD